jgi:hypothetical protein
MHSFDPEIAKKVGVNAAVIYQNIVWWTQKNAANKQASSAMVMPLDIQQPDGV